MPLMNKKPVKKEKTDFESIGKMLRYCKRYTVVIVIALVAAVAGTVCTIVGPQRISKLTNLIGSGIITGIDTGKVFDIAMGLAILYAAGAILSYCQQFIMATVTQNVSKRLRSDINSKLNRLPLKYFDTTTKGDILSRVTNDVDVIGQTLSSATANLVSAVVLFFGVIYKMFSVNAVLAGTTVISSLVGFGFMSFILSKSQKYFVQKQTFLGEMNGQIEEVYTNHSTVKAYTSEETELRKFRDVNERIFESNWKSQFLSGLMQPIMAFSGNLAYVMIFVVGMTFIVNQNQAVTIGTLIAFIIYARLFSQPLGTLAQSMTSIQQASAAGRRVFEILEADEMEKETANNLVLNDIKGEVEFCNIRFGYTEDKTIIGNFSAKIKAGQKVAIVGPTGAGKTTIVNLLMRFYEVQGGDIKIDGVSIKSMTREHVRDLFDMILQDTWLFNGTLRENLVYNKEGVTDEDIDRICSAVGLSHFIKTLPNGYDTYLDDSTGLSEGQKQQITVARAMIKDSPLLILDEATSNVDTRTELVIQAAMDKLTENRTSFVIAHRLSTVKNADMILVLKDGDIIESGNHEQLLKQNGFYADMYNSQFEPVA